MEKARIKRILVYILSVAVLVWLDRLSKIWAVNNLMNKDSIWIIKNVLQLYYLPNGNRGAAWGMLEGHQMLFVIIATLVVMLICFIVIRIPDDKKFVFLIVALTFIAAGGIGNMYDRITQGYVVDFIYFSLINFPIFNVADIYVSVFTCLLALYLIFKINEDDLQKLEESVKQPLFRK